ncbi:MarR family transcriptional regulator, partial [Acinetobacter baumannii]
MIQDIDILRELSVAEKLSRVSRLWKMVADRELEPLNLTYPRWTALWKLYRMGDNVSQKHLAEALEIELSSLMRTLKLLEEQSLVIRRCCEYDKRA